MVALAFLLIAESPVVGRPDTPENLTVPTLHYDCQLASEAFERKALRFHTEGGRGYRAGNGKAERTPIHYVIDLDGTGELAGLRQLRTLETERGALFMGENLAAAITEVTPYLKSNGSGWPASLVLTVDYGPNVRRYAGFCRVESRGQQPLTPAETRELTGR